MYIDVHVAANSVPDLTGSLLPTYNVYDKYVYMIIALNTATHV